MLLSTFSVLGGLQISGLAVGLTVGRMLEDVVEGVNLVPVVVVVAGVGNL